LTGKARYLRPKSHCRDESATETKCPVSSENKRAIPLGLPLYGLRPAGWRGSKVQGLGIGCVSAIAAGLVRWSGDQEVLGMLLEPKDYFGTSDVALRLQSTTSSSLKHRRRRRSGAPPSDLPLALHA
jgi:hypothetical protein